MMWGIVGINSISLIILQLLKDTIPAHELVYIDDNPEKSGKFFHETEVQYNCSTWENKIQHTDSIHQMSIALGEKNLQKRKELFQRFGKYDSVSFPVVAHPSCMISDLAVIDAGNILSFGVIIGHQTQLKSNSVYWSGAVIEHDCVIGSSCYIAPNATVSGYVKIGDCTLVGSGAVILPEVNIGSNCIIGAGSVVTRDVPDNTVVAGVPAKIWKTCR
jgi:sugar O-acyltransferase (sialic acid O-acetyltransferase NeuD family)